MMDEKMTLEQANALLDQAIHQLENDALPMSESVQIYARACELMAYCMQELDAYRGKINDANEKLVQYMTEDGNE